MLRFATVPASAPSAPASTAPAGTPTRSLIDRAATGVLGFANRLRSFVAGAGEKAASVVASRVDSSLARAAQEHFRERRAELHQQAQQLERGVGVRAEAHKVMAGGQTAGTLLRSSTIAAWAIGGGALPALAAYGMRAASTATKIAVGATTEATRKLSKVEQERQFIAATSRVSSTGWRRMTGSVLRRIDTSLERFISRTDAVQPQTGTLATLRTVGAMLAKKQREELWLTAEAGKLKGSAIAAVTANALAGTFSAVSSVLMGGKSVSHLVEQREQLLHAAERIVHGTRTGIASALQQANDLVTHAASADETGNTRVLTRGGSALTAPGIIWANRDADPKILVRPTATTSFFREPQEHTLQHPWGTDTPTPPSLRHGTAAPAPSLPPASVATEVVLRGTIQPCTAGTQPCTVSGLTRSLATQYARTSRQRVLPTAHDLYEALRTGRRNGHPMDLRSLNVVHPGDEVRLSRDSGGKYHVEVVTRTHPSTVAVSSPATAAPAPSPVIARPHGVPVTPVRPAVVPNLPEHTPAEQAFPSEPPPPEPVTLIGSGAAAPTPVPTATPPR